MKTIAIYFPDGSMLEYVKMKEWKPLVDGISCKEVIVNNYTTMQTEIRIFMHDRTVIRYAGFAFSTTTTTTTTSV